MSSSGQAPAPGDGAGAPGEDRSKGLTKFIRRASKVLRPKSIADELSETGAAEGGSAANAATTTTTTGTQPAPELSRRTQPSAAQVPPRPDSPLVEVVRSSPTNATAHFRHKEAKARAFFAKYNMALEPGEWVGAQESGGTDWVEKKVRMRVHRQCHRCQTGFGADKTCVQCAHTRCKKCPRHPDKSNGGAVGNQDPARPRGMVAVDSDPKYQPAARRPAAAATQLSQQGQPLSISGKDGADLIRKQPVQRVRRSCHRCDTLFVGRASRCESCQHVRCAKCPREPPKPKKFPEGYPGDAEETFPLAERTLKNIRMRVRWECHECHTCFREHERGCHGCKHDRCDRCTRWPPKKARPQPNPAVLKRLEERMARIGVSPAA